MRPLLVSLLAAADAAPTDVTLRLHVVELLREHGEFVEAVRHCATALAVDPSAVPVRTMMRELLGEAPPPLDRGTPPSSEATVPHPAAAPVVPGRRGRHGRRAGRGAHRRPRRDPQQPGVSGCEGHVLDVLRPPRQDRRVRARPQSR